MIDLSLIIKIIQINPGLKLELHTLPRIYLLRARTIEDLKVWTRVLTDACKQHNHSPPSDQQLTRQLGIANELNRGPIVQRPAAPSSSLRFAERPPEGSVGNPVMQRSLAPGAELTPNMGLMFIPQRSALAERSGTSDSGFIQSVHLIPANTETREVLATLPISQLGNTSAIQSNSIVWFGENRYRPAGEF